MTTFRDEESDARHIDYCLNILGIRVWKEACQLVTKAPGSWLPIGPKRPLPVDVPHDYAGLEAVGNRAIEVTVWQYVQEHPDTDLREVLAQRTSFEDALIRDDATELPGDDTAASQEPHTGVRGNHSDG